MFNRAKQRADKKRNNGTEMLELGKQYVQNFEKYGTTTWYDWCIQNWGTKWNSYSFAFRDEDTIQFDTAWSRPESIIRKLAESYPNLTVDHWWADEDIGYNTGHVCYEDGCEYGGPVTDGSTEAYEIYVFCCGECNCLFQTNGVWVRKNCETCHDCGDY